MLKAAILDLLLRAPATAQEVAKATFRTIAETRQALSDLYFDGRIGCDRDGRYHRLGTAATNGAGVVRHVNGQDVPA